MKENTPLLITENAYLRLGKKTFWLFFSNRLSTAAAFLVLAIIVTLTHTVFAVPVSIKPLFGIVGAVFFLISFAAFFVALVSSWLTYRSYAFCVTSDALKIKSGIFVEREIAIPFHQIQNVSIERHFSEQIAGLSRIIILTGDQSSGILPAIDKDLASALQEELLKRADVQKVVQARM